MLANTHVVKEVESEVQVELQDGRVIKGHVTNIDEEADLALVKLELDEKKYFIHKSLPFLQGPQSGKVDIEYIQDRS